MFKISMRNSLKDIESINFDYILPQSAQQYSREAQQSSYNHSIQNSMNKNSQKNQKPQIQNTNLIKSKSQNNYSCQNTPKINENTDLNEKAQEGRGSQVSRQRPRKLTQKFQRKKNKAQLKRTVSSLKTNNLVRTFIQKLKRNNIYSSPIQNQIKTQSFWRINEMRGVQLSQTINKILVTLFILNYIVMLFIVSITIVINELRVDDFVKIIQITGITINSLEILLNFLTIRFSFGRKLQTLGQIAKDYAKESFIVDLLSFAVVLISSFTNSHFYFLNLCKVCILFKLPHWFQKIKKLEVYFIQNYYKEQYWSLVKVFLFNFLYAHILAVVLLCMAEINPSNNWLTSRGLQYAMWYQKYVWSYYWSTTTILTIGFGDITPSCYQEALVMIFIETISCVILAYNINCVGTLISNIRMQDEEKHKDLRVFKKLAEKNRVSEELSWKINNFIEEHSNIKKLTNIEEEAKFVEKLPSNYKVQYLKESNKSIFKGVYFFSSLMEKTLCSLAQSIKVKITHPLEVLLSNETNLDLLILKDGEVACKSNKSGNDSFNKRLVNKLRVSSEDRPFLLHTNFITKQRSNYKIISTVYSLLYYLNFDSLLLALREFKVDFQLYCQLKDKCGYHIDEFEVFSCKNCNIRHTQFDCPKQHFIPFKQHVVRRQLAVQKAAKNIRQKPFQRVKNYQKAVNSKFYVYFKTQNQNDSLQTFNKLSETAKKDYMEKVHEKIITNILNKRKRTKGKIQNQSQPRINSLKKIQQKMTQALKAQLGKILGDQNFQDQVWLIQTDKMVNFKMYFSHDNPQNLELKFSVYKRKQTYQEASIDWAQFKEDKTCKNNEAKSQSQKANPFLSLVLSNND